MCDCIQMKFQIYVLVVLASSDMSVFLKLRIAELFEFWRFKDP